MIRNNEKTVNILQVVKCIILFKKRISYMHYIEN